MLKIVISSGPELLFFNNTEKTTYNIANTHSNTNTNTTTGSFSSNSEHKITELEERIKRLELSLNSIITDRANTPPSNNITQIDSRKKRKSFNSKLEVTSFQNNSEDSLDTENGDNSFDDINNQTTEEEEQELDIAGNHKVYSREGKEGGGHSQIPLSPSSADLLQQLSSPTGNVRTPFPDWKQYIKGTKPTRTTSSISISNNIPDKLEYPFTPNFEISKANFDSPFWAAKTPLPETPFHSSKTKGRSIVLSPESEDESGFL